MKYYTTAMIHIISQINVDPRRLRSPFTYCHNALRCTKKLTRNHQFRLPHCGARCRPTYISTSTNLHINADQLTYQRRPTYISTRKYSTNYHWRSKDNCLAQTADSKAAAVLHTILRCSQVEFIPMGLVIPMTNLATFIQLSQTDHVFKQSCLFKSHFFFEFLSSCRPCFMPIFYVLLL